MRRYFVLILLAMASLTGCSKKDTVLDFGGGDSIRLVGKDMANGEWRMAEGSHTTGWRMAEGSNTVPSFH